MSGGGLVENEGDGEPVREVGHVAGSAGGSGGLAEGDGRVCSKLSREANSAPGAGVGDVLGKTSDMGEESEGEEGGDVGAEMAAL